MKMNKKNLANATLAALVAVPALVNPTASMAAGTTAQFKMAQSKQVAVTPRNAKRELMAELQRLTPKQKAQIGAGRIDQLADVSGGEIVRGGCFTSGVGCQGTSGFTQGVICCVIKKTGI
jgi:hypothetical protein